MGAGITAAGIATANPWLAIGGASAVFGSIMSPILDGRREQWLQQLGTDLIILEGKLDNFNFEEKIQEPRISSAIIETTQSAIKTEREDKREFLKNAVLNISITKNPDIDKELIFLRLIDEFIPIHVRVLQILAEPELHIISILQNSNPKSFDVPNSFIGLTGLSQEMYNLVLNNLRAKGLLASNELHSIGIIQDVSSNAPSSGPIEQHYSGLGGNPVPIPFPHVHELPEPLQIIAGSIFRITVDAKNYVSPLGYEFLEMIKNPLTD